MAQQPDPWPSFLKRYKTLEDQVRRLRNSSPFFGTGLHPNGQGGIDSDNYVAGSTGYRLAETPEFNNLKLRGGIIGNDALTDPVIPGSVWRTATGFSVAVAWSNLISWSVTVPAGCTRLEADAKARVTAFHNASGVGVDYLYADLSVGGQSSGWYPVAVTDNGGSGTNHVFRNVLLTGLNPGDTVAFVLRASTSYFTWAGPYTYNEAQLGASLRWMR